MKPTNISLQALRNHPLFPTVDLQRASGKYVIVDPMNSTNLLYVSEKVYLKLVSVALSNDETLTVILVPGEQVLSGPDGRPLPSSSDGSSSQGGPSITPLERKFLRTWSSIYLKMSRYSSLYPIVIWTVFLTYLVILQYHQMDPIQIPDTLGAMEGSVTPPQTPEDQDFPNL
nr:MAG: hypothetical protein H1Bulk2983_000002 [Mitovirus sp.]